MCTHRFVFFVCFFFISVRFVPNRMIQWVISEVTEVSPTDLVLGLSCWALKWSAYLCALSVLLLGCFLAVARCMQRKSLKQLEHLPGSREMLPFLNDYIIFKACSQPDNPAGFGACK